MSSFDHLKAFVNERLTAAAEEIFVVLKKTIVEYEKEIDRQRKLLDYFWKPEIKLSSLEVSEHDVTKDEDVFIDQQEKRNYSMEQHDTKTPLIKAEQMDIYNCQEAENVGLKRETDTIALTPVEEDNKQSEDQILDIYPDETVENSALTSQTMNSVTTEATTSNVSDHTLMTPYFERAGAKKLFRCDTCGKDFKCKPYFQKHMKNHTVERPFSCSICDEKFKDRPTLNVHLRCHRDATEYSCSACGSQFYNSSALQKHMRIHTNEKPFICTSCGSAFRYRNQLSGHMATHSTEKPYICQTCRKGFQHMSALRRHRRQHTGEKPYSCTTCGKDFIQSSDLTVHIRRAHTGEKPYVCSTCGKGFTISSDLSVHMRTHTGERPYVCITCGKVFKYNSDLRVHIRRTHCDE